MRRLDLSEHDISTRTLTFVRAAGENVIVRFEDDSGSMVERTIRPFTSFTLRVTYEDLDTATNRAIDAVVNAISDRARAVVTLGIGLQR